MDHIGDLVLHSDLTRDHWRNRAGGSCFAQRSNTGPLAEEFLHNYFMSLPSPVHMGLFGRKECRILELRNC